MRLAHEQTDDYSFDWREALKIALDFGLPSPLDVEWLIDKTQTRWGRTQ